MEEIWKQIVNLDLKGVEDQGNVEISNLGNIKGVDNKGNLVKVVNEIDESEKEKIRQGKTKKKRRKVHLGSKEPILLSHLVAHAFLEPRENPKNLKFEIHHIDKECWNDKVDNLQWVTHEEHVEIHKND